MYSQIKLSEPMTNPFSGLYEWLSPPRVLLTGSRRWSDWEAVNDPLQEFPEGTVVIHGGAKGLDSIAEQLACALGFKTEVYEAEWDLRGLSAGPTRNQEMLDKGKPTEVLAFPLPDSKGTIDMIKRAWRAGLPVRVFYQGHEIDDVQAWVLNHFAVDLRRELSHQYLLAYGREPMAHELAEALQQVLGPAKLTLFHSRFDVSVQLNRRRLDREPKP